MGRLSSAMPVVVEPGVTVRAMTDRQLLQVLTRSAAEVKPCTRVGADREEWLRQASSELADRLADRRAAVGEEMRARRLCAGCPVRQECLELALRGEPAEGVQGGTTERSRRTLRHRRARGSGGVQQPERKPNVMDFSAPSSSHPGWCDPRFCRESDIEVHHRSAPTVLPLADYVWRLSLLRCDEAAEHGGLEPGEPELHAVLSDARVSHSVVQVSMLVDEVPEVCAALMRQYYRAQMLTAAPKRAAS